MRRIRRFGVALPYSSNRVKIFDLIQVLDAGVESHPGSPINDEVGVSGIFSFTQDG